MTSLPYYTEIVALSRAGVNYVIVGGVAVNMHGMSRITKDLDIIPSMDCDNLKKLLGVLNELNYRHISMGNQLDGLLDPEIRESWHKDKGMLALSVGDYRSTYYKVIDILIWPSIDIEECFSNKEVFYDYESELEFYYISLEDLIKMKVQAGRPRDHNDLKFLYELREYSGDGD